MVDMTESHIFMEDAGDLLIDASIASGELGDVAGEVDLDVDAEDIIEEPCDFCGQPDCHNPEDDIPFDAKECVRQSIIDKARAAAELNSETEPELPIEEPIDGVDYSEIDKAEDLEDLLEMAWNKKSSQEFYRE